MMMMISGRRPIWPTIRLLLARMLSRVKPGEAARGIPIVRRRSGFQTPFRVVATTVVIWRTLLILLMLMLLHKCKPLRMMIGLTMTRGWTQGIGTDTGIVVGAVVVPRR